MGDIVAPRTIAAGDRPHELAVFVSERDGDAVNLGFDDELQGARADGLGQAFSECHEIGFVVSIVQR